METPRPKPAPPKNREGFRATWVIVDELSQVDVDKMNTERLIDIHQDNVEFPPLNFKSPDGTRVISVKDPEKAKSLVKNGWTLTNEAKTPYVRPEHLSDRPLAHHEGLQNLIAQMGTKEKPLRYKNTAHNRANKKRISLNKKENN